MKRTFIAIKTDAGEELEDVMLTLRSDLKNDSVKWVDVNNIHITMAFLGDTGDDLINRISMMLKKECTGFGRFGFTIKGLGVFRSINDPRIIWAGIDSQERFESLYNVINGGLKAIGFKPDERGFRPHITLGRIKNLKSKSDLQRMLEQYKDTEFQTITVSELIFYESILLPAGPLYKPISIHNL